MVKRSIMMPPQTERPQGFEDGKLAKRGVFRCTWGCGKTYPTFKLSSECHCESRRLVFEELVQMNKQANKIPPQRYLYEANAASETLSSFEEIKRSFKNQKNLFVMAWLYSLK